MDETNAEPKKMARLKGDLYAAVGGKRLIIIMVKKEN